MEKNNEQQNIGKYIFIGVIILAIVIFAIIGLANSDSSSGSSSYKSSGSSSSGSSSYKSSGSSSSGSSSYKSSNPADYDSKGNYKPVESMTQKEIKDELTQMLKDSIR